MTCDNAPLSRCRPRYTLCSGFFANNCSWLHQQPVLGESGKKWSQRHYKVFPLLLHNLIICKRQISFFDIVRKAICRTKKNVAALGTSIFCIKFSPFNLIFAIVFDIYYRSVISHVAFREVSRDDSRNLCQPCDARLTSNKFLIIRL